MKNIEEHKKNNIMNKFEFIEYTSKRYGIDESVAETMVDMFADTLQELLGAGCSVEIDDIGKFEKIPLFPNGLNHQNNIALARLAKNNMVCFRASKSFTKNIA